MKNTILQNAVNLLLELREDLEFQKNQYREAVECAGSNPNEEQKKSVEFKKGRLTGVEESYYATLNNFGLNPMAMHEGGLNFCKNTEIEKSFKAGLKKRKLTFLLHPSKGGE